MIQSVDPNFLTSKHPNCALEGGVFFWLALLSPEQVELLRASTLATVSAILPNAPWELGGVVSARPAEMPIPGKSQRRRSRSIGKREAVEVITQLPATIGLSFLSTAEGDSKSFEVYNYLSPAGEGISVYMLDTGVDTGHQTFEGTRIEWDWAVDVKMQMTDDDFPSNIQNRMDAQGTCAASLIAGNGVGVARNLERLVIVKINPTVASVLDGLGKVVTEVSKRNAQGRPSKGRVVVNLSGVFPDKVENRQYSLKLKDLTNVLVNIHQVIVVTPAGIDTNTPNYVDINSWPSLLAADYNILSVGSVRPTLDSLNGNRFLWSKGGPLLRVQGPGISICAGRGQDFVEAEGGGVSQAIVTGLVAYFLSLPDIGNLLRSYENTPKALIRYMQTMSYAKSDGTESVWNGLSHASTQQSYDHWFGEPAPSKKTVDFQNSPVFLNN